MGDWAATWWATSRAPRAAMFYAGPSKLDVSFSVKRPYAPLGDRLADAFLGSGAMPIPLIRELIS